MCPGFTPPARTGRRLRRLAAALLLIAALALALRLEGAGFGSLLWATAISVAAFAIALTLAWRPRWLRVLALPRLQRPIR